MKGPRRRKPARQLQIFSELYDPLADPGPVFVPGEKGFPGNLFLLQAVPADIALGAVHDLQEIASFQAPLRHMEIGEHIPHDPVVVEIGKTVPHPEGNALGNQLLHQLPGLGVRPEQHGDIPIGAAPLLPELYLIQDTGVLLLLILKNMRQDRRPLFLCRPDVFGEALLIVADHPARALYDRPRAAVIRIQQHPPGRRIVLLKMQHDLRLRAPEAVDGLIVVPHDKKIVLRGRQHPHDVILELVDVLKLIHQDVAEFSLPGP